MMFTIYYSLVNTAIHACSEMKVNVALYALPKERVGAPHVELEIPDKSTCSGADVRRELGAKCPMLIDLLPRCLLFVGNDAIDESDATAVTEGAKVTLVSPVSGG